MAICQTCKREMLEADSCIYGSVVIGRKIYKRWRHMEDERCGDCGVKKYGIHHEGCDMEDCPKCDEQMIGCGCNIKYLVDKGSK